MSFSSIMTFLCIAYILVYAGMILYDMFLSKEAVDIIPHIEEEEIDISDEVLDFQPIEIEKDAPQDTLFELPLNDNAQMTGGMDFKGVKIVLEDLAVNGEKSGFAEVMDSWRVHDYAA